MNSATSGAAVKSGTRIVRVLAVVDTREYQEEGDRIVPVPGSGNPRPCDRCGRMHEVHATVLLDDGDEAVVGTGCAAQENVEIAPAMKAAERRAKALAKARAVLSILAVKRAAYVALVREVEAMPLPAVERAIRTRTECFRTHTLLVMTMGDATVYAQNGVEDDERRAALVDCWRRYRLSERGAVRVTRDDLYWAEAAIKKLSRAA